MTLDLTDPCIRARQTCLKDKRMRLVIDYPRTQEYHDRVMAALAGVLTPHGNRQDHQTGFPTPWNHEEEPTAG